MKIAGSHLLPFDRQKTYYSLQDPAVAVRCLPDFESLEEISKDEYAVTMRLAFDKLSGVFTGKIKITGTQPPHSFKILVEGDVMFSFVKGEGVISLKPASNGTELTYDGDVQVAGAVAALGQRVINTTAKLMIRKFFDKFTEEVKSQT